MSAKGNHHELLKVSVNLYWAKRLRDTYALATETTFRITPDSFLEPDFVFYPTADTVVNLRPANALLVVEISHSSLGYDLGRKAGVYAQFGIRELWVMNAMSLETHVHTDPADGRYTVIRTVPGSDTLHAAFAPELDVSLKSLKLA